MKGIRESSTTLREVSSSFGSRNKGRGALSPDKGKVKREEISG
jgi:hypothetical protein